MIEAEGALKAPERRLLSPLLEGVKLRELHREKMIQTRTKTKNEFPMFLVLW